MYIDTQFLSVKTVGSNYSWDQGNPNANTLSNCLTTESYQYIGYAPFVSVQLESRVGSPNLFSIYFNRKINFGDYYNSETNNQTTPNSGAHVFCHNYLMPGEYTITIEQTQYYTLNNAQRFNCLEKYCLDWNWDSRKCAIDSSYNTTWYNTTTASQFQKRWVYEPCEDDAFQQYGIYIERGNSTEDRLPFSWQWYNFFNEDSDVRNEFYASFEPRVERLPATDLPRTWDDSVFQGSHQVTWDEASGPCLETRVDDASWKWNKVSCNSAEVLNQKVKWKDTTKSEILPRKWKQVRGAGCLEIVPLLSANKITSTEQFTIKVLEIPPQAYLQSSHVIDPRNPSFSPLTVQISPKYTQCGSFPIEKIVWDFGDGSPLVEQSRYNLIHSSPFVYSDQYGFDVEDPRNYDVVHTYYRTSTSGSCFYPSITAYCSSTGSHDCASVIVGPLNFESAASKDFHLLQNKLTEDGKAYLGEMDRSITVWNSLTSSN
jgi:hypothetical protein